MSPPVVLFVVLLYACGGVSAKDSTDWDCYNYGYGPDNGPSKWSDFCSACGQPKRSPIWISIDDVVVNKNKQLHGTFFDLGRYSNASYPFVIQNDGHTVTVKLVGGDDLCIRGDGLNGEYRLGHVQFRWGTEDGNGTEHQLQGDSCDGMERQWGFYSKQYESYEEASKHEKGIAMMAQRIRLVDDEDYPFMKPIVNYLPDVREPGQCVVPYEKLPYRWLLPEYYEDNIIYQGTLTTPPCTGGVLWAIFAPQKGVTRSQLAEFRKLKSPDGPLLDNRRPLQEDDHRQKWTQQQAWLWPYRQTECKRPSTGHHVDAPSRARALRRQNTSHAKGVSQKHRKGH